jgi:hypothetical protein
MNSVFSKLTCEILTAILAVLFLAVIEACGRRPDDSRVVPPIAGHYAGSGSYIETHWSSAPRLNVAWNAEFIRQSDSVFVGSMTSTYTDTGTTMTGESMQWGIKGIVTLTRFVTIVETSMVRPNSPKWIWGDQQFLTNFDSCTTSVDGDTIYYSGPAPELEKFVLVRRK